MNLPSTVLILGAGGREHALLKACLRSPAVQRTVVAPGNGGIATEAETRPIDPCDSAAVLALAREIDAGLVIIGPEAPLAAGIADHLRTAGFSVFGPGRDAARLESSKAFCKAFFQRHNIPTAAWERFDAVAPAVDYLRSQSFPIVVKASGLAAGKGVLICEDFPTAEQAVRSMLQENRFGESGHEIVIEEFLTGAEASLMVLVSGSQYCCLPPSQDHKRIGEGDTGPNTGGMGAYAPASVVTPEILRTVRDTIIAPTLQGFQQEGIDYRGVLFIGLMMDENAQPRVLEYNVRFGDPECQVLLPLCRTDPVRLMTECAHGTLQPREVEIAPDSAIIVVLAAEGYPGPYRKHDPIQLPDSIPQGVTLLHAGTALDPSGQLVTAGGRVLGVTAVAHDLPTAAKWAYHSCDQISWPGKQFRRDIAHRQLRHPLP